MRSVDDTRALEADAQQLLLRVQLDDLSARQLRLAAYLGSPAAVLAVDERVPARGEPLIDPDSWYGQAVRACSLRGSLPGFVELLWIRGLGRWGVAALARGGLVWLRDLAAVEPMGDPELVHAIDQWLRAPGPVERAAIKSLELGSSLFRAYAQTFTGAAEDRERSQEDVRRWLLETYEALAYRLAQGRVAIELEPIRAALTRWALSPHSRDRLADDQPRFLPHAPTLRERVIAAETSGMRLKIVDTLQRRIGRVVTLVFVDGRTRRVEPDEVGLQAMVANAKHHYDLDRVLAVRG